MIKMKAITSKIAGILAISVSLFITSCQRDADMMDPIDQELEVVLHKASGNIGKAHFQLPSSSDFGMIPQDPKNPLSVDKVALGKLLFHETKLGLNPRMSQGLLTYSCASCHHSRAGFQSGLAQGIGEGGSGFGAHGEGRHMDMSYPNDSCDMQPLRSPSALNVAYQTNMLWNGQFGATHKNVGTQAFWTPGTPKSFNTLGFQGPETQAIAGQNVHRLKVDTAFFMNNPVYKALFDKAFMDLPESERITQITVGLAIAAYERTLLANEAPFQQYLKGYETAMGDDEKRGAILFFGKAGCYKCHNGPALNSMEFYALGMGDMSTGNPGVAYADPNKPDNMGRGSFTGAASDMYKFKVPQLYNIKEAGFYGHGGNFTSVKAVVEYKNAGVSQNSKVPSSQLAAEFVPLHLSAEEVNQLVNFIEKSLRDPRLDRYVPSTLPSGQCFPNNDAQSRIDMGCN